jgi:transcriptional regulator with XRE-family HTH domain
LAEDDHGFGARLGACRESAGLTQEELAQRSGLSVRAIRNLERGRTLRPFPDSARRLAAALDLSADDRTSFLVAAAGRQPAPGSGITAPRQLPGPVRDFAGRETDLAMLTALLDGAGRPPGTLVAGIAGIAGVGKTALALHWAHQRADRFPDGQLYVNLRGYDPSRPPVTPGSALRGFLGTLGVAHDQIPADPEARAGLYRSLLAGRRMLIVADNARDTAQARPLLPGSAGCLALVTSRSRLAGLAAADGAQSLTLDVFSEPEAARFLALRLGPRMRAEPRCARQLIAWCERLPLALSILAARAAAHPGFPLAALAGELRDPRDRLDALDTGDAVASLRASFASSYRQLAGPAAVMFQLISAHPGPDITVAAAGALAGIPAPGARRALRELARVGLLAERAPGRYACHGLLRAYAAEQLAGHRDDAARPLAVVCRSGGQPRRTSRTTRAIWRCSSGWMSSTGTPLPLMT